MNIQEQKIDITVAIKPVNLGETIAYVGQCLEYDICVQGDTVGEVQEMFLDAVEGHCVYSMHLGETPFQNLKKPPQEIIDALSRMPSAMSSSRPLNCRSNNRSANQSEKPQRAAFVLA